MKSLTAILPILLFVSCGSPEETAPAQPASEVQVKRINVETLRLTPEPFDANVRLIGEVKATKDIRISSEVAGKIVRYYAEEGQVVQKGQPIVKVDDSTLLKDIERMEAMTASARETYNRLKKLYEEEKIGSEIDFLNAGYVYQQQRASLEQLKIQLTKTTITAPMTGVLEDRFVEVGEMVSPGSPVVRFIESEAVKIIAGVPARYSTKVKVGDKVQISFDALQEAPVTGTVVFVGSSIESQSRTYKIEILLPNTDRKYKVNMIANVTIQTDYFKQAIVLDQQYVFRFEGGYQVFVVGKDEAGNDVAHARSVTLGVSSQNRVVISEGLKPGEEIITTGSAEVENMTRINIVRASVASR